jgi:ABC-type branched-subunit amino acid transport system substrate-binding protein
VLTRPRALASSGVACLAALAIAGCGPTGSSSSSSAAVTVPGSTLRIYISEPRDLSADPVAQDIVKAEQLAFAAHQGEVHDYRLNLQTVRGRTLTDNARTAIIDPSTVAYLGEIAPGASDDTVGITNAQDLLQVSPTDNALELTDASPAVSGGPKSFFESWSTYGRTFARLAPSGAAEARAQVAEMKRLGVSGLYVASDGSTYGRAIADAVLADARRAGISRVMSPAGAGAAFYGAVSAPAAARFFNHLSTSAPNVKLFGPSSLYSTAFSSALSSTVQHLYVSVPGFLPKDLPAAGRSFVAQFKTAYGHTPNVEAIFGYEAMSSLLRVLAGAGRQADNRTDVVKDFLKQHEVPSVLGVFSINGAGNTSLSAFVFARLSAGKLVPFTAAPTS